MASPSIADIGLEEGTLMPIGVETLRAAGMLPFDLYQHNGGHARPVLYRQKHHPVHDADLRKLVERGVHTLYIPQNESSAYREYLRETLLANEDIPPLQRYQILREATRSVLTEALSQGDPDTLVEVTGDFSAGLVRTVCDSQTMLRDVLRVMSHDYSVFTHAANVATHCLLLARQFGICGKQELLEIGQGALLHDIGLQGVPRHIIDKPDKLTERERRIVQEHPAHGFQELCQRDDLTWGQLMMVYSHHERCDGRGYPVGLLRAETHEYARICAIADVYEALCRDRPYRRASRRNDVLEYLDRQAGRAFDEEMTRCWIAAVDRPT
jgi:HD-GYP domain-containing protein (c-di-GMP phosphodiesterase class II)